MFTKTGIESNIEKLVSGARKFKWAVLYKINITEKIRDELMGALDLMNINYSTLFPDLVGSAMNVNVKLEQTDYIEKKQDAAWGKELD